MKTETEEIVEGLLSSVSATEQFLDMLRNIGRYDYRKKIHMSDVELTNMLNENITAQLMATREYFLMFEFLKRSGHQEEFKAFRAECMKEIQKRFPVPEVEG